MSFLQRLQRLYYTIKPLRVEQIVYRLKYRIFPLKHLTLSGTPAISSWCWQGPEVLRPSLLGPTEVCFLNRTAHIESPDIWNNSKYEKLWLYNLHYFDDLNAVDNHGRWQWQLHLVQRWIDENPAVAGNGWEPYPISLRLVNWVKWFNRTGQSDPKIVASMALQAQALTKQLEYHILGNHLFANAKALVFVGAFMQGEEAQRWLKLGLTILQREIPEQFLEDGGHFELSPMYHCILLWDLLELIQLAHVAKQPELDAVVDSWCQVATKALHWLSVMIHPDHEVSFFNDSAMGIAASPLQIFEFAKTLGLFVDQTLAPLTTLPTSGYSRAQLSHHTVLFDHAAVGPDYLPGHAHADTLSLEWSIGVQRVLVNSGTSIYGISKERLRQRQTAAHNTVVVDGQDSSEVWSGFRVARRAYAKLEMSHSDANSMICLRASHDGYMRLKGRVKHGRHLEIRQDSLEVSDELTGSWKQAQAMYHLHPDISVQQKSGRTLLILPTGVQVEVISESPLEIISTTWHPRFGESMATSKLVFDFTSSKHQVCFRILQG